MKFILQKYWYYTLIMVFFAIAGATRGYATDIIVVTSTGKTINVQVKPEETVMDLKQFVYNITEIHPENQIPFKNGVQLINTMTLGSYNIQAGDTIYIKLGVESMRNPEDNSGGFIRKLLLIAVIIIIVVIILKKTVLKKPA